VVAHLVEMGAAGDVGRAGQHSVVGVLVHPDDVGRQHPPESVDERDGEPFDEFVGSVAAL